MTACLSPAVLGVLLAVLPAKPPPVDFDRHVMGLLGRMGCNSASCHGSFQGRGGFRLSLFGSDADFDYAALTHDALGRRINRLDPDRSLLLFKPTAQVEHGGGRRFARDSWQYQLLRDWLRGGARRNRAAGQVVSLAASPPACEFRGAGDSARLVVRAHFSGGPDEDVTRFCEFRIGDDAIARADADGRVRALRPGDTHVIVSYRGNVLPVRVLVPAPVPSDFAYPDVPENNFVDRLVLAKLRRLNVVPSDLAGDEEFLRRITIDTIGCLPSPAEVRAFLADTDPDKRLRKIDELLAHPLHAALWATKFCDITGNNTDALELPREKRSKMWHDWLRRRLADNVPYDQIVRGILCATSRDGRPAREWMDEVKRIDQAALKGFESDYARRASLDLFWRQQGKARIPVEQVCEKTGAAFLGVRIECAQCHKHPFDRWTQADYRSYANVFSRVVYGVTPETKPMIEAENAERKTVLGKNKQPALPPVREVFVEGKPAKKRPPAKALGGPAIPTDGDEDPRAALFEWMRAPDNPYFARSFVNRVWGHYFGVGVVDPVDDFSQANPPSNPELLDALARDLIASGFDIRRLERTVLASRVYQLSAVPNESNRLDRRNYSHAYLRPLAAEQVVDVLNSALGVAEELGKAPDAPPAAHAVEVAPSRVQNGNLAYAFRLFGRPPRTSSCDCERASAPALPQALYLMDDPVVLGKIQSPKGRLRKLLTSKLTDDEMLDELFLATLTRYPRAQDRQVFAECRAGSKDRPSAFTATLWALINTREFILNH